MVHNFNGWNPLQWFKGEAPKKTNRNRRPILESLENREVPATILVTNLLDSTNASFPLEGSLRKAIALAKSGDEIRFDESLFPEGQGAKRLTLNGAVGDLVAIQNNVAIVGPGKFITGNNDYKLLIQSDIGFSRFQPNTIISNGGSNYRVGDVLDQGSTQFFGGAAFQVMSVDASGAVTQIQVINPGFVKTRLTDKNNFKMPFIISPEEAAKNIVRIMQSNKFVARFPFIFANFIKFLSQLPYWLYFKIVSLIN